MLNPLHFTTVYGLAAVACWGTSDFIGGYATRRANAFLIATIVNFSGLFFISTLAIAEYSPLPSHRSLGWAFAGGISGGFALAFFYRALSSGRMGLTAPVSAVLGAAIPTAVAFFSEGLPSPLQIAGFFLAGLGIWMVSRPDQKSRSEGVGLAVMAGIGFAGFFLCMKQAGNESAFWIAAGSRASSLVVTATVVMFSRAFRDADRWRIALAAVAGCLDISGSVFFIRASQTGRLDKAVVISSLYPVVTVLLARMFLRERFTRWKAIGVIAALVAVPMISMHF